MLNPYILQNICPTRSWYRSKNEIFVAADTVQIYNSKYFNATFSDNLNNHDRKSRRMSDGLIIALVILFHLFVYIRSIYLWVCKLPNLSYIAYIEMQKMMRIMFMTSPDRRNENELNEMTYISHTRNWYQSRAKQRGSANENESDIVDSNNSVHSINSIDTGDDAHYNQTV